MYFFNRENRVEETDGPTESRSLVGEINMEETVMEEPMDPSNGIRDIRINPLSSGYLVKVGCQSVAVESTETLLLMLTKYLDNPNDFEKVWNSKNVRNRLENFK